MGPATRRVPATYNPAPAGFKGESSDKAMAGSFNELHKWERIYPKGLWRGLDNVELATLTYVDWFNNQRLRGTIELGPGFTSSPAFEVT